MFACKISKALRRSVSVVAAPLLIIESVTPAVPFVIMPIIVLNFALIESAAAISDGVGKLTFCVCVLPICLVTSVF